MQKSDQYIHFDWAAKRLLRNKANFGVLERFITVLIGGKIIIQEILESEGNQTKGTDYLYHGQNQFVGVNTHCRSGLNREKSALLNWKGK